MNPSPTPPAPSRRKATLFCPDCGHESAVGGDWLVHEAPGRDSVQCPDCGMVLTSSSPRPCVSAD